jgi:hypothetical protein
VIDQAENDGESFKKFGVANFEILHRGSLRLDKVGARNVSINLMLQHATKHDEYVKCKI